MIYLDNAATTYVKKEVIEAMLPYFTEKYGNASSSYKIGRESHAALDEARKTIADVLGADKSSEIFFTSCGTESDNWAIKGVAYANRDKGKHIITSKVEHHAVLETCEFLETQGFEVTYVDVDKYGMVQPETVKEALRDDTIIVSIMYANNEVGTINPIAEIGKIVRERGIYMHTDAVQAAGNIPIDVNELNVDLLSISGHKFYAPKGIGALYIREGVKIEKFMNGGHQERSQRAGTENVPYIVGMAKALKMAVDKMDEEAVRKTELRDYMIKRIFDELDECELNGHPTKRLPGNVNVSLKYIEAESSLLMLDMAGIACSSGSACNAGVVDSSHVLLAMGVMNSVAKSAHRFSLGDDTTKEDIDFTVDKVVQIVKKLRELSPIYKNR